MVHCLLDELLEQDVWMDDDTMKLKLSCGGTSPQRIIHHYDFRSFEQ